MQQEATLVRKQPRDRHTNVVKALVISATPTHILVAVPILDKHVPFSTSTGNSKGKDLQDWRLVI